MLDILSLTFNKKKQMVTKQPEKCSVKNSLKVENSQMFTPEKNAAVFISWYLLRRFPNDNCKACHGNLQQECLPERTELSAFEMIKNKNYRTNSHLTISIMVLPLFRRSWWNFCHSYLHVFVCSIKLPCVKCRK